MLEDSVTIGGGQAALSSAVRLRDGGHEGTIMMIGGEEPWLPYQRPPLPKAYLLGDYGAIETLAARATGRSASAN
jgi:3-phenylpropionate/trans-cinnamate dioxygenase ferredoxin reductase subunit